MSSRVLVAVAHPDDEALWASGYLLEHPGTDVLCCSIPKKDPERCVHFFDACRILGANGYFAGQLAFNQKIDLTAAVKFAAHYDEIITHNEKGEYGHPSHIAVHQAMKDLGKPMRVFGYGLAEGDLIDYETKLRALSCYKTRPNVFANQSKKFDLSRECLLSS